jgi:hypothetical protein
MDIPIEHAAFARPGAVVASFHATVIQVQVRRACTGRGRRRQVIQDRLQRLTCRQGQEQRRRNDTIIAITINPSVTAACASLSTPTRKKRPGVEDDIVGEMGLTVWWATSKNGEVCTLSSRTLRTVLIGVTSMAFIEFWCIALHVLIGTRN